MGFPFSTVITAVLKGNVLGFGVPVAKEMTDFGDLINVSATINLEEKKKLSVKIFINKYISIYCIIVHKTVKLSNS